MNKNQLPLLLLLAALFLAGPVRADTPPFPLEIAHDTTRITAPLLPDGTPDYDTALWTEMSRGITPDNNAGPLFQQIEKQWKTYAAGVNTDPDRTRLDDELFKHALHRPWKDEECLDVAKWIDSNESSLALAVDASTRPRLCSPQRPAADPGFRSQFKLGTFREVANALTARALRRVANGDQAGARSDLDAVHRVAVVLANEPDLIGVLLAIPLAGEADAAELAAIRASTRDDTAHWLAFAARIPPVQINTHCIDVTARFARLDQVMRILRGHPQEVLQEVTTLSVKHLFDGKAAASLAISNDFTTVDWNAVLKHINAVEDDEVAVIAYPDLRKRSAAAAELARRHDAEPTPETYFDSLGKSITSSPAKPEAALAQASVDATNQLQKFLIRPPSESQEAYSLRISYLFTHFDATSSVIRLGARFETLHHLTTVAMALEAYHLDHTTYPDTLAPLAPAYLPALPPDPFTNTALHYQKQAAGYLLYSVGPDGHDDGGEHDGHRANDDIPISYDPHV